MKDQGWGIAVALALCVRQVAAFSLPRVSAWVKSTPSLSNEPEILYMEDITTIPELLAKYHARSSSISNAASLLVAPNLEGLSGDTHSDITNLLSGDSWFQGLYSPGLGEGDAMWGPHVSLHHVGCDDSAFCAPDTAPLTDSEAMDKVFLWLQRTLLGYEDDAEGEFITLGRKLLSVGSYVVTQAASEAGLSAVFWEQASAMQRDAQIAQALETANIKNENADEEASVSVLLAAPAMAKHPDFAGFFGRRLGQPLQRISSLAAAGGGSPLIAEAWVGGGLDFPVILLSPPLPEIEEPEGGYKIFTTADGEVSAEEYIAAMEEANAREQGLLKDDK
ncbi:hypothetical protein JKP88DRAFT_354407 [Tribonema minus]|uniref:Uncharacterized protein n=1 Tax=Tribonema minus TaxID=303371 RepID=A0A836CFG9_9STRA|nr:hypothetical protein JKP88DRAFT_354407 [Tribonema minus]